MSDFTPTNAVVWFEIPVSDLDRGTRFYEAVLQTKLSEQDMGMGPIRIFPVSDQSNPAGHLFQTDQKSDSQMVVHLDTPGKLEDTLTRVREAGGEVVSPIVPLPAGQFAYCNDPDGNRVGFFSGA